MKALRLWDSLIWGKASSPFMNSSGNWWDQLKTGGGGAGKEDYFNIWPVWNTFFETMVGSIWQCRLPTNPLEQFFPQLVGQLVVLTLVISFVAELFFLSMLTLRLACQTTRLSPCTSGLLFWVWALWLLLTFAPDSTIRNQLQNGGPGGGARCKRLEGL